MFLDVLYLGLKASASTLMLRLEAYPVPIGYIDHSTVLDT
jgi:hypothetical protein